MLRVMSFLTLKDNARIATVCKYFRKCYNSIWLNFEYFSVLDFQGMGANQANHVLQHGGRLPHIKQVKKIVSGKNSNLFFKKNVLKTRISAQFQKDESLFEEFSLKPAKPNLAVLITDKDIIQICDSSRYSLMYVNLMSCHLLTSKSFVSLAACVNMQHLTIKGGRITDEDAERILRACKNIKRLSLSGCEFLTDLTISIISDLSRKLETLDLSGNPKMEYNCLHKLTKLSLLHTLNLGHSPVKADHFLSIFRTLSLKTLQVDSKTIFMRKIYFNRRCFLERFIFVCNDGESDYTEH